MKKLIMLRIAISYLTASCRTADCGFNSKATFNRAVKKATGKSPKEWGN